MSKRAMDEGLRPALARGVRLQIDPQRDEPVLLFPEGVIYLSATAHAIVMHCNGKATAADIISSLAVEYEVGLETLRGDVIECLTDLHERKLLQFV